MASGFGVKGTRGRCHAFWMDFSACMSDAAQPAACAALREDYMECLHHRKEARATWQPVRRLRERERMRRLCGSSGAASAGNPRARRGAARALLRRARAHALTRAPRAQFNRINEVVRERKVALEATKSAVKAQFEHKWFNTPLPEGAHGH
jgi:hypothetical protein